MTALKPNDIDEVQRFLDEVPGLRRQIKELKKAGKTDEEWKESKLLSRKLREIEEALRRQIDDLVRVRKYAEAVPLAECLAQAVEVSGGAETKEVAKALIDLAELLIAVERSAEAEPALRRAFAIVDKVLLGSELRERISQIDTGRLVQSVSALRNLIAYSDELPIGRRMFSREPFGAREISAEEAERQRTRYEAAAREATVREAAYEALRLSSEAAAVREEERRRQRSALTRDKSVLAPPVASAPAPRPADVKRERVVLARKLARSATTPELDAAPDLLAALGGSPHRSDPDPSTPQGALAIEAGRLAYQIPDRMWVGVQETVEVRLGALIEKEIDKGFGGRGEVKTENVPIVETMKVSLVCEPGAFDIEPRSEDVQLVKPDLVKGTAFHQHDFAKWKWLVTPRQRGKHTLFVKVSAAIRDSRGLPTTSSLPDKVIAVTVRVHIVTATIGTLRYVAPLVLSGVVTALVGIFTKDYWWPYVRDTLWPAVLARLSHPISWCMSISAT